MLFFMTRLTGFFCFFFHTSGRIRQLESLPDFPALQHTQGPHKGHHASSGVHGSLPRSRSRVIGASGCYHTWQGRRRTTFPHRTQHIQTGQKPTTEFVVHEIYAKFFRIHNDDDDKNDQKHYFACVCVYVSMCVCVCLYRIVPTFRYFQKKKNKFLLAASSFPFGNEKPPVTRENLLPRPLQSRFFYFVFGNVNPENVPFFLSMTLVFLQPCSPLPACSQTDTSEWILSVLIVPNCRNQVVKKKKKSAKDFKSREPCVILLNC